MGFHIPDSPRSRTCTQNGTAAVESQAVSVSVGTSMASDEDEDSLSPPPAQPVQRPRRRNAMTPMLIMEVVAAQNGEVAAPTNPAQALLQFQAQLRSRGLLPPDDQTPKHPTPSIASDASW
jgi:hypothetical protein